MFGIVLGVFILIFGLFLKVTKDPKLATSKKFSWMFILIGILSVIGKLFMMYQKGEI